MRQRLVCALSSVVFLLAGGCTSVHSADQQTSAFADPKPPKVIDLARVKTPALSKHPGVTFHAKPKPLSPDAVTEDWPDIFGPRRNMTSRETRLLREFPKAGPTVLWELEKGTGYSSPSIVGDRLVYLYRSGNEERVDCVHPETGELYWTFSYPTTFSDRYGYNNGPRASPVIDGDRVYTYGAQNALHCLRLETGQLLWKREIAQEFGVPQDFFGTATTPLIDGQRLIINVGAPDGPTVAAFDRISGKMLWGAGRDWGQSYSSPVAAEIQGRRRLLVFAGGESRPPTGGLLSINPADGAVDFAFPWRSRSVESVNAAVPVVVGNRVLVSATYRTGAALLEIQPDFSYKLAWTSDDFDLHWTTAIEQDGYLYAFAGRNEPDAGLMAVDLASGKTIWREVLEWDETVLINGEPRTLSESPYRGSLLKVDGSFLALGEHGHLMWLDLSPEGVKILSRATLFLARETWSPPIVSRGLLYVNQNYRSLTGDAARLLCYDLRAP